MNFIMSFLGKSSLLSCSSLHSRVGSAAILTGELVNFDLDDVGKQQSRAPCLSGGIKTNKNEAETQKLKSAKTELNNHR